MKGRISMENVILILIVVVAIALVINGMGATEFCNIARMKGHPDRKYFWWCFLFGVIGWCMVIALPDRSVMPRVSKPDSKADELPDL